MIEIADRCNLETYRNKKVKKKKPKKHGGDSSINYSCVNDDGDIMKNHWNPRENAIKQYVNNYMNNTQSMKTIKRIRIGKCDKALWLNRAKTEMLGKLTGPESGIYQARVETIHF